MTFQEIKAHDQAHIMNTYGRSDACIAQGKGALCKDTEGKRVHRFYLRDRRQLARLLR